MAFDGASVAEIRDRAAESVEQDHTARMCWLILFCTLREINASLSTLAIVKWTENLGFVFSNHSERIK